MRLAFFADDDSDWLPARQSPYYTERPR